MPLPQILPTDYDEAEAMFQDDFRVSQLAQYLANFRHMENLEIELRDTRRELTRQTEESETYRCTADNWKKRFEESQIKLSDANSRLSLIGDTNPTCGYSGGGIRIMGDETSIDKVKYALWSANERLPAIQERLLEYKKWYEETHTALEETQLRLEDAVKQLGILQRTMDFQAESYLKDHGHWGICTNLERAEKAEKEVERLKAAYYAEVTWAMQHIKWED